MLNKLVLLVGAGGPARHAGPPARWQRALNCLIAAVEADAGASADDLCKGVQVGCKIPCNWQPLSPGTDRFSWQGLSTLGLQAKSSIYNAFWGAHRQWAI